MEVKKNGKMSEERRNGGGGTESYSYRRGLEKKFSHLSNNLPLKKNVSHWTNIYLFHQSYHLTYN